MAVRPLRGPFTVEQYHRMGELGILREDDRVELIHGQVVEMTPIGPRHAACVDRLTRLFSRLVGDQAILRIQSPVVLGLHEAPQPDLALLRPPIERYSAAHPEPTDIMLAIEVADTPVDYDRSVKLPLYAQAGIPEAWLVNLPAGAIEVHWEPRGGRYPQVRTIKRDQTLTPRQLPGVTLRADEILG